MRFVRVSLFGLAMFGALFAAQQGAPVAPTNLKAAAEYEGAVAVASLSWVDESDNETGFEVLRSDNGAEFRVVGFVGANTINYKDKVGKYISGSFSYKVRAFNQQGRSPETGAVGIFF